MSSGLARRPAVVVRSQVQPRANYADYEPDLRFDFWYACAYCSLAETEGLAVAFQIDHYVPQSAASTLANSYDNLMWACQRCNRYKSNETSTTAMLAKGYRFIRVDVEDPRDHLRGSDDRVIPTTSTGEYTVEVLDLNRLEMRRVRELRERLWKSQEFLAHGFRSLLGTRLEELPREAAFTMREFRARFGDEGAALVESMAEFVRASSRSPLLDLDHDRERHVVARREYLRALKVITPDVAVKERQKPKRVGPRSRP